VLAGIDMGAAPRRHLAAACDESKENACVRSYCVPRCSDPRLERGIYAIAIATFTQVLAIS
jgi:hypothetical protein